MDDMEGNTRDAVVKTELKMMTDWMWEVMERKKLKIVSGLSGSVGILEWNKSKVQISWSQ